MATFWANVEGEWGQSGAIRVHNMGQTGRREWDEGIRSMTSEVNTGERLYYKYMY